MLSITVPEEFAFVTTVQRVGVCCVIETMAGEAAVEPAKEKSLLTRPFDPSGSEDLHLEGDVAEGGRVLLAVRLFDPGLWRAAIGSGDRGRARVLA
jgi:hypothetical protein